MPEAKKKFRELVREKTREALRAKKNGYRPYKRGRKEYLREWSGEMCEALVAAGEFKSVKECKKAAADEARAQAKEWGEEAPEEMAEYIRG